jgi:serine phosphatase RsbU (regulator of sigma subunit)
MKSGGDYFDVFEFPDENHVGFLLCDSSSYSLSNNFLSSLLQFSTHLAAHDPSDPRKILENLFGKMKNEMKEKDEFSILYGILNRKNYLLRTVSCGSLFALHEPANGAPGWIADGKGAPLTKLTKELPKYTETSLDPSDRLILLSDGWQTSTGESVKAIAERLVPANKDGQDLVNEFAFTLHKKAEDPDAMPEEDCSILILEIAKNVLRLAR